MQKDQQKLIELIKGKKVAFIGAGVSHKTLIKEFVELGAHVTLCDQKKSVEDFGDYAATIKELGIDLSLGENYLDGFKGQDIIMRTPGFVGYFEKPLQDAMAAGTMVTSEVELFFDFCPCEIVAVTGSDGKTTTTTLISKFYEAAGRKVHLGGNIGAALLPMPPAVAPAGVIIRGRGGGSAEDLWEFNDETLARKIALSPVPVISAVGHETDFTICDFVADMRAPTPSAAAELAVPNSDELKKRFAGFESALKNALKARYERANARLSGALSSRFFKAPEAAITERRAERTDRAADKLISAYSALLSENGAYLAEFAARLDALSPLKTLARGYAVAVKSGKTVRSVSEIEINDGITLKFADGSVKCEVTEKEQRV